MILIKEAPRSNKKESMLLMLIEQVSLAEVNYLFWTGSRSSLSFK